MLRSAFVAYSFFKAAESMSSPAGSFVQQHPIVTKKTPQTKSKHIIMRLIMDAESMVARNMKEQKMSNQPRPLVDLRKKKLVLIKLKSQKEITIKNPKKI